MLSNLSELAEEVRLALLRVLVEAGRTKKGSYYKTSDGEIFWLEPLDERDQVKKDLGELLTEDEKIKRVCKSAIEIITELQPVVKQNTNPYNDQYYGPKIQDWLDLAKAKQLSVRQFKQLIGIYNIYVSSDRIPNVKKEMEIPQYIAFSDSYHEWTGRAYWFDDANLELHYFDQQGVQKIMSLIDMRPIDDKDIIRVLEMPFQYDYKSDLDKYIKDYKEWHETKVSGGSYSLPYFAYADIPDLKKQIDELASSREVRGWGTVKELEKLGESKLAVDTIFKTEFIAPFIAQDYADKYKELKVAVKKAQDDLMGTTPDECPAIPNLKADLQFFPHQAKTLAVLNKTDHGVIDVDMGGGKTLMILSDILNLLSQNRIRKPCIVLPNNTIAQQKDEMESFTDGSVNFFVINTFTQNAVASGSEEKDPLAALAAEIKSMPANTVFLISYEWLSRGYELKDYGFRNSKGKILLGKDFTRSKWLLNDIGIDYVALDESHRIKNPNSGTAGACLALSKAKVRRIATGTLIPNNPMDIVTQMAFIDPTVFGTVKNVVDQYAEQTGRAGVVIKWLDEAPKQMRKKLLEHGAVSIRRSHWMHLLPEREEEVHKVQLTSNQQKVYEFVINDILSEIQNDPTLKDLWEKMQDSDDADDDSEEFGPLLAKLVRLDSFLCAPASQSKFVKSLTDPADKVSPKVAKIDEILKEHFANPRNGKAIIFVQNLISASSIMEASSFKDVMLYYDASLKENVQRFKDEDGVKVLVAVDKSLREGHNLQVANCVIRADIHWSPGAMEQSYGRVFRPKQKRKVKIHIIVTDNTAEVTKYARLVSKAHVNRKINSDFDDDFNLPIIKMNLHNMMNFRSFDMLGDHIERSKDILDKEKQESKDIAKKFGSDMVDIKPAERLKGEKVLTPYVPGSNAKYPVIVQPYLQKGKTWWLVEDKQSIQVLDNKDARTLGFRWFNNAGKGGWWFAPGMDENSEECKTWLESALNTGYDVKIQAIINEDGSEIDETGEETSDETEKDADKEETKKGKDKVIELYLVDFDGHLTLGVPKNDDDAEDFKKFGFKWKHQYFWRLVKSKAEAVTVLDQIEDKLDLNVTNRSSVLSTITSHKILTGPAPSVTAREVKKGKSDGDIKVHFTVIDGYPFLTVSWAEAAMDLNKLKQLRFKWEPAHYWCTVTSGKVGIDPILKKINSAGYKVSNWKDFVKGCKKQNVNITVDLSE